MNYCNYFYIPPPQLLRHHQLIAAQRQLLIAYQYSFNLNTEKAKHLHEVKNPPAAM